MLHPHEPVETWERRPGASLAPLRRYRRREPEKTLLHRVVRERLEPFLAAARDRSATGRGLPGHVERDLRAYLGCGILANGFARIRCPDCGFERLVAFSCKARSCPSCNARRMEDAAEHLVEEVFPAVPVRQWVLSFPRRLRLDRRMRFPDPFKHPRRSAHLDGYSLHAGVRIHANDREGRERLCRDAVRPPFALDRLSLGEEGRLLYRTKRPRGESLYLLLTPDELLARMATLVPPPRSHALRYHGLFAPNAKHRGGVVPGGAGRRPTCGRDEPTPAEVPEREEKRPDPDFRLTAPPGREAAEVAPAADAGPRYRVPWAELLRKVFALDVLECPRCAGRLEVIAYIAEPTVARRILDHLGLASQGPPLAKAPEPADDSGCDPGPDYSAADPAYVE